MTTPFIFFDRITAAEDAEDARSFYSKLFNWTMTPESHDGPYARSLILEEHPWGAIVASPAPSPAWVPYIAVADLAASVARAELLGASIVSGPTDWTAGIAVIIADPHGALLALWGQK